MFRFLFIILFFTISISQKRNVDIKINYVKTFILEENNRSLLKGNSIDPCQIKKIEFEVETTHLSNEKSKLIMARVERYLLLKSESSAYAKNLKTKYKDFKSDKPVWVFNKSLSLGFKRIEKENSILFKSNTLELDFLYHHRPLDSNIEGYGYRVYVYPAYAGETDIDNSNNVFHLEWIQHM